MENEMETGVIELLVGIKVYTIGCQNSGHLVGSHFHTDPHIADTNTNLQI